MNTLPQSHHFGEKKKKRKWDDLGPEDECCSIPGQYFRLYLPFCSGEVSYQLFCVSYGLFEGLDKLEKCPERSSRVGKTAGLVCILACSAPSPVKEKTIFLFTPRATAFPFFYLGRELGRPFRSLPNKTRQSSSCPPTPAPAPAPAPREFRDPGGPPSRRSEE